MQDLSEKTNQFIKQIEEAKQVEQLEELRIQFFGKKGYFSQLMQELRNLDDEKKPIIGQQINSARQSVLEKLNDKKDQLKHILINEKLIKETIDVSLPGKKLEIGGLHPVTMTINRVVDFFSQIGFDVASGPEVENDYYNFDALNIPSYHPARADQDTFWFDANLLLRTQTSGVQIREMEKKKAPIKIIVPGRVYRNDYDQTHTPMFHQIELLYVDKKVNFAELKGLLHNFLEAFFEETLKVRFRPSYFPFTEPSAEVDVMRNNGKWLEILGCGMVHPQVLKNVGIDPDEYSGFAAGMGVERLAMLRYQINDLRSFFENDVRFLKQFN